MSTHFGRYELIRRVGAGGMGEVFLAREQDGAQRVCVVKKVLPDLAKNPNFVGRFRDETKVVVRLRHPHIARVYAMGEVDGEYFLAMEYVQGKTVSRFMRRLRDRGEVLPLGLVLLIGERVCEGLAYAHDANDEHGNPLLLVHRDLSPANVCVSYRGEVKIIDFGAAQSTLKEQQTAPRVVIGNLAYMAPEQARKKPVDRRADVYSVGAMLWELLSWQLLPQKGDPAERWRRAANPQWAPPSQVREGLAAEVDAVVLRALEKDPEVRFAGALELGDALRALRVQLAPEVDEVELGAWLARAFQKEKETEDTLLAELAKTETAVAALPTRMLRLAVPATARAFEHPAISVPPRFDPEAEVETDPGIAPFPEQEPLTATRVVLGVALSPRSGPPPAAAPLRPANPPRPPQHHPTPLLAPPALLRRRGRRLRYFSVFLFASGIGFFAAWLWWRGGF